jgi:hypothetical protein
MIRSRAANGVLDLLHLVSQLRAAGNFADEDADEIGIGLPGAQHDPGHGLELFACRDPGAVQTSWTASSIRDQVRRKIVSNNSSLEPK